jgi:uncharacterized membrane protein
LATRAHPLEYPPRSRDLFIAGAGLLLLVLAFAFQRHLHQPASHLSIWMVLHLAAVIPALPIGAAMVLRPKGDRLHRVIGYIWIALMAVGAITSFGITELLGTLSPIHILSVITIVAIPRGIIAARAGRIRDHRRGMTILYAALVIAGYFTLLPTRLIGHWLFS